ncbi:MAG: hypothetical protein HZB53_22310 [Chloroflexi bacterium]|nr:hypothetical protein [Chloroflexota bacterium]
MIELAPQRKHGCVIAGPLIAGPGAIGYSGETARLIDIERFGALVTAPVSLRPRKGNPPPRMINLPGGLLLAHGEPSPGWYRLRERYGGAWLRSRIPVIAHVVGRTSLGELARRIEATGGIAALMLDVPDAESLGWLEGLRAVTELPILARLRDGDPVFAARAVEYGADALVAISSPQGVVTDPRSGQIVEGGLYGPFVHSLALRAVRQITAAGLAAPLIACGGVHTPADVTAFLAAGACAVMVDSLAWVDPAGVNQLLSTSLGSPT